MYILKSKFNDNRNMFLHSPPTHAQLLTCPFTHLFAYIPIYLLWMK